MKSLRTITLTALALVLALSAGLVFGQILSSDYYYPVKDQRDFQAKWKSTITSSVPFSGSISVGGLVSSGAILGTTITGSGAAVINSTAKVKGALTADGGISTTGTLTGLKSIITITTSTALTAAQCAGTVVYLAAAQGNTTITVTMPTLAAGYDVTFVDNDNDSGADLEIQMATGDKINGGTAAKMYKHVSTSVGTARFISVDATDFVLAGAPTDSGNWSNDNN